MEKKSNYTLPDIAGWAEQGLVSLPSVQRGFVWRPSQIENLWDSLLRGYPIGAFVMSPKENNGSFEMLDGQQRATSICLGFGKKTFKDSQDKIKVFIDLDKPKGDDNRKYIFRIITRSHPWGYQKSDNTKTLISDNIRKAMNLYGEEDHLEADLNKFFPYDASLPIPFNLFIDAAVNNENIEQLLLKIDQEPIWKKVEELWNEKNEKIRTEIKENAESKRELPQLSSKEKIKERISEIFLSVKDMLNLESGQKIPALYLDFEKFKKGLDNFQSDEKNGIMEEEDSSNDEIENLFIRLNAGGTPLSGEELNYSILKAHIDIGLQNQIELSVMGLFKPSRFITIAYRLFQQHQKLEQRDALTMRIKPKQFQKTISESLINFEIFLIQINSEKRFNGKTILEYVKDILEYDESENNYGLPYLITSKISYVAPEVMFMLLFRIMISGDKFEFNSELHRRMIGMITLFIWLGKGEKQRDHAKLLSNIWPSVKKLEMELFWSASTVQRAKLNEALTPFPSFDRKHDRKSLVQLRRLEPQSNSSIAKKFDDATNYGKFIDKMFYNRDLVLYAQRRFLAKIFKEHHYDLEDTNVPFDWDHISPSKYVYKQKNIPRAISDWYFTIGNLRAWPYSLNRMDQDNLPAKKLNPFRPANHSIEEREINVKLHDQWNHFILKNNHLIQNQDELTYRLLEWSFCDKNWSTCEFEDIRKEWKLIYSLIMERNLSICKEWYTQLRIEDLLPKENEKHFAVLDNRKWELVHKNNSELKDYFDTATQCLWLSKPFSVGAGKIHFYFLYSKDPEKILESDGILFGIWEKLPSDFVRKIKIPEKLQDNYVSGPREFISGNFTLITHDDKSYIDFLVQIKNWLNKFPKQEVKQLTNYFVDSLVKNYQIALKSK